MNNKIVINRKLIHETIKKIQNEKLTEDKLKELLGGDKLNSIFDSRSILEIIESLIKYGAIHPDITHGDGLNLLEGLLNSKIVDEFFNYYRIKPEYIIKLPLEEQVKLAKCFSYSKRKNDDPRFINLPNALKTLWNMNIKTKYSVPYGEKPKLILTIDAEDFDNQDYIQILVKQEGTELTECSYDYINHSFNICIEGNALYNCIAKGNLIISPKSKENIFENTINHELAYYKRKSKCL